ncbi:hypothetical protein OXX79_007011 [Metschnikowia pulcherrima]
MWLRYFKAKFWNTLPKVIKRGVCSHHKIGSSAGNALTLTDPYSVYLSYVRSGKIVKDESQLRIMKHFQKLYGNLVDYKPDTEIAVRKSLMLKKLKVLDAREKRRIMGMEELPIHRLKRWLHGSPKGNLQEVVRYMSDEEELRNISSPQGLLVNGSVGSGKSMLLDIFAASLPHHSKMRWHYNSFILWVFGEIHRIQKERLLTASVDRRDEVTLENEYILFEVAQIMIEKSTIFMLDEFMLPDIASAQVVRILFTFYFKLGGVLIATSNKLPEELYSSDFNKFSFKSFVSILNSRCLAVDMDSGIDYRRHFANISSTETHMIVKDNNPLHDCQWQTLVGARALGLSIDQVKRSGFQIDHLDWKPSEISVYNRASIIPKTFDNNVCYLSFDYICKGLFSSSDYITLASTYRTFIIDDIPVMTAKMKNEARRFITLLDALYEAKCQLFLRIAVAPERSFFPSDYPEQVDSEAVQQEEMFAKTAMQTFNPYRPNISSYDQCHAKVYNHSEDVIHGKANFGDIKAFTGEDEKFAYERAVSRIYEMVASDDWRNNKKWTPFEARMRPWEASDEAGTLTQTFNHNLCDDRYVSFSSTEVKEIKETFKTLLPREVSARLNYPFGLFNKKLSPAFFDISHFWGLGRWSLDQQKRVKDKIAQTWMSGGVREK